MPVSERAAGTVSIARLMEPEGFTEDELFAPRSEEVPMVTSYHFFEVRLREQRRRWVRTSVVSTTHRAAYVPVIIVLRHGLEVRSGDLHLEITGGEQIPIGYTLLDLIFVAATSRHRRDHFAVQSLHYHPSVSPVVEPTHLKKYARQIGSLPHGSG